MCLSVPGEVTAVSERDGLPYASVRSGGVTRDVCLACQPEVVPGDVVLVNAGLAIAKIDRARADGDAYRDPQAAARLLGEIARAARSRWVIMAVCGAETHAIVRQRIDRLRLPPIELVHAPGCPVYLTAIETVDRAHAIAALPDVVFTSFADMLRVPGSRGDLLSLRGRGADVRVVDSPLDAVGIARANPDKRVVFMGVGFETTAPASAMALVQARRLGVGNFSMLAAHGLAPPSLAAILQSPGNRAQALLGPGDACAVAGVRAHEALSARHGVPIVITGSEPVDLLEGILMAVRQLEAGQAAVQNQYARAVARDGNTIAKEIIGEVFQVTDRAWRGLGAVPGSGYEIRDPYRAHDADRLFAAGAIDGDAAAVCISDLVLRGLEKPCDCPAFGTACTPRRPLGATMASAEGACAASYQYARSVPEEAAE